MPVVGYAETDTIEEEFEDTINEKGCDTTVEPNNVRIVKNNIEIDDFEMMALGEVDGDDQTIVEVVDLSEEEVPDPGDEVYTVVTQQPEFPGGEEALMDFIKKNQEYPASALEKGIQGRVRLSFVVEKDGSLTNIEVLRSPTEELSQEAIRIVKMMPKWHPGTLRDKPVRVKYVLPVTFRLDENNKPIK
ncbi:MAG: energy transducer TonB [Bacteroidales bacterium]|nr:energy transducer TonB [Bacteroidales bacterium]